MEDDYFVMSRLVAGRNTGWRCQFRIRGSRQSSGLAHLYVCLTLFSVKNRTINKIMRLTQISQIGMLVAAVALSGCSKQEAPATQAPTTQAPTTQEAPIVLRNVYFFGGPLGRYRITELENTGKTRITAFQGKWTIKDDLDAC